MDQETTFDFVVVGAGSAGCVVAARLAEDTTTSVLLIDAGVVSRSPLVRILGGIGHLVGDPRFDWQFQSEPDPTRHGRITRWPAGKVVGGGSAINGMVFSRGLARDYDGWAASGCPGWSAADVLPFFQRLEHFSGSGGAGRGCEGPLAVEFNRYQPAVLGSFLSACGEVGIPVVDDINAFPFEGVGCAQASTRRWGRHTSAGAYLANRPRNLELLTEALATRVVMDGPRCTGVRFERGGIERTVHARRATVLCAGALGSPKLLMLSGIGPPELLRRHGIGVLAALPGVGRNLQDHPAVSASLTVTLPTITDRDQQWFPALLHGLRWVLRGDGVASGAVMIASGFVRSTAEETEPDLYLQLAPFAMTPDPRGALRFAASPSVTTICSVSRPEARGAIEIRSGDAHDPIKGELSMLSAEGDRRRLVAALRLIARIHAAPSLLRYASSPGALPAVEAESDEALLRRVHETTGSQYHPVGTCRMGSDGSAVVDPRLRVHGLEGLYVADASVMPRLTSANTNAPVLMIGERAAAFIRGMR